MAEDWEVSTLERLLAAATASFGGRESIISLTRGLQPTLMSFGPEWNFHRQLRQGILSHSASQAYRPIEDIETRHLLYKLLSAENQVETFLEFSPNLASTLTYGGKVRDEGDFEKFQEYADLVIVILFIGTLIIKLLPILDRIPPSLNPWRKIGEAHFDMGMETFSKSASAALKSNR